MKIQRVCFINLVYRQNFWHPSWLWGHFPVTSNIIGELLYRDIVYSSTLALAQLLIFTLHSVIQKSILLISSSFWLVILLVLSILFSSPIHFNRGKLEQMMLSVCVCVCVLQDWNPITAHEQHPSNQLSFFCNYVQPCIILKPARNTIASTQNPITATLQYPSNHLGQHSSHLATKQVTGHHNDLAAPQQPNGI